MNLFKKSEIFDFVDIGMYVICNKGFYLVRWINFVVFVYEWLWGRSYVSVI